VLNLTFFSPNHENFKSRAFFSLLQVLTSTTAVENEQFLMPLHLKNNGKNTDTPITTSILTSVGAVEHNFIYDWLNPPFLYIFGQFLFFSFSLLTNHLKLTTHHHHRLPNK
jgi:hypothetical protein